MIARFLRSVPWLTGEAAVAPPLEAPAARLDFDAIYDEHMPFVWRVARHAGIPEASVDDVVQDVFVVVHRRLGDYDWKRPLRAWLYGIVVRVIADHRRSFRRKQARLVSDPLDGDMAQIACTRLPPSEEAENAEALRLVLSLLDRLEPEKQEVLVLSQVEEMSVPEIAECLEINVNTAYARLRTAKRELDALLARQEARAGRRRA